MGATNSWKYQDNFVNQTVRIFSTQTWILAHWLKTFVRYTHLNLLHEHNVIYAKETYLIYVSSSDPLTTITMMTCFDET